MTQVRKGDFVRLREDLNDEERRCARRFSCGVTYRVLEIVEDWPRVAWLGPANMSDDQVARFDSREEMEDPRREFAHAHAIPISCLRAATVLAHVA